MCYFLFELKSHALRFVYRGVRKKVMLSYAARLVATCLSQWPLEHVDPKDEVRLPMRVLPMDVDPYFHLNNGRYLTLMDFGRYQYAVRTGALVPMLRRRFWPLVGGIAIRYRRSIDLWRHFNLVTRLCAMQGKWFYFEQRFESQGSVHAHAYVRFVFRHNQRSLSVEEVCPEIGWPLLSDAPPDIVWEQNLSSNIVQTLPS